MNSNIKKKIADIESAFSILGFEVQIENIRVELIYSFKHTDDFNVPYQELNHVIYVDEDTNIRAITEIIVRKLYGKGYYNKTNEVRKVLNLPSI